MWQGHTLQDLVICNSMQGLDLCASNAISTMTVHVLQDATSATRLATYLVTVGARQMPMLPTIRGARVYTMGNAGTNPDANTVTEMGSFDVIIDMDWLSRYQAVIVCADKIVHIPWGRETLIFHGDGSNQEHEARLNIISCAKTQKYMLKGCQVFLAHVTTKEAKGKSWKKRLENVPIVRDFPE
nr:reverse transcriptase domain-containing protein [Tanacetum cinerariifolium]